jgi:anti-sigma-K factor RskA
MAGRIYTFEGSEHSTADALLPWYVNGTLRGEELAFVEHHVRTCRPCQAEIDWLRQVFAACSALSPLEEESAASEPRTRDPRAVPSWTRPMGMRAGWRAAPPWVRGLLAAQLAAIAVLGTTVAIEAGNGPSYQTLGTESRALPSRNGVVVVFDPAAPEAEIRRIVAGVGGRIVDGPTAANAYVLELPAPPADGALQSLRAESLVRLAESLGPAPAAR